jgi:hypothetical protein
MFSHLNGIYLVACWEANVHRVPITGHHIPWLHCSHLCAYIWSRYWVYNMGVVLQHTTSAALTIVIHTFFWNTQFSNYKTFLGNYIFLKITALIQTVQPGCWTRFILMTQTSKRNSELREKLKKSCHATFALKLKLNQ